MIHDGIVDGDGVGLGGSTNDNTLHFIGLEGCTVLIRVGVLVEVDNRGEGELGVGVRRDVVDDLKQHDEFSINL